MEIIFELLGELFLDASVEASTSKKVPAIIRIPLFIVVSGFFLFISLLMMKGTYAMFRDQQLLEGSLFLIISLVCIIFLLRLVKGGIKPR